MALEIEDGSGKVDSNSYVTVAEARAYAQNRGVELPSEDSVVEAMLINAADYLEAQRSRYQGHISFPENPQAMQFPRTGVVIDCVREIAEDEIPRELKRAQMQCCIEIHQGLELMPSHSGREIKRTKTDVLEREYMTPMDMGNPGGIIGPSFPAVDALLEPLFYACGFAGLRTVRV